MTKTVGNNVLNYISNLLAAANAIQGNPGSFDHTLINRVNQAGNAATVKELKALLQPPNVVELSKTTPNPVDVVDGFRKTLSALDTRLNKTQQISK